MAIPAQQTKVVLHGTLLGGEEFDPGFWLDGDAPISDAAAGVLAASIASIFEGSTAFAALRSILSTDCAYTEVRVYGYPTGGPRATAVGAAPVTGGTGTGDTTNPLQVCCCLTLQTANSGRRNRGRIYLPMTSSGALSAHEIASITLSAVVEGFAAFLGSITSSGPGPVPTVVSFAGSATNHITSVKGDTRPDIQRRRANREAINGTHTAIV